MKILGILSLVLPLFFAPQALTFSKAPACQTRQGSIELGSGSTKAYAAQVDACTKRITAGLHSSQVAIPFNEALEKSDSLEIPDSMIAETVSQVLTLKKKLNEQNVQSITGFATAAFRKAKNAEAFLGEISRQTGVSFKVISQDEEARLGYLSASSSIPLDSTSPRDIIVWDIGGGSMQMQAAPEKNLPTFKSDLASVTFKNQVIREILRKDPSKLHSPNPLGRKIDRAIELARKSAEKEVPEPFRNGPNSKRWIGVGGVLTRSIQAQVNPNGNTFTRDALAKATKSRSTLTDLQIGGDYAATDLTNLALVLGFMENLGITEIETVAVALGPGWLLDTTKPK